MFCYKCGEPLSEGVNFCQKCGAKLIQENHSDQVQTTSSTPDKTSPASKDASEIFALLETNAGIQSRIKSVKRIKNAVTLNSRMNNYIVSINNRQAGITSVLAFPFSILYGLPIGFLAYISSNIGWNLMEYGSLSFEDYALPLALLLLSSGLVTAFAPLLGHKEKVIVTEYVRGIVEPEGISLAAKKKRPAVRYMISALFILIGVLVLLFSVLDLEPSGALYESAVTFKAEDNNDDYDLNHSENISLTQIYENEDEGFSFMYPEDWEIENVEDINPDALVSVGYTGAFGTYARIAVIKDIDDGSFFAAAKSDFEELYSSEEGISNVKITDLSDTVLDGCPARKLTFTANNDIGTRLIWIQYFYIRDSYVYCITCVTEEANCDRYEPRFNAILDSFNIYAENMSDDSALASVWGESGINELYYGEIPLTDLLDKDKNEVCNILGAPASGTPVTGELLFGGTEYYEYNGLVLYFDNQTNMVDIISVWPSLVRVNGTTLNKGRAELIRLLGEPSYEDYYNDESGEFDDYYYLQYTWYYEAVVFDIEMPSYDGIANAVTIYRYDDGPGDEWVGGYDDPLGSEWNEDYASDLGYGLTWAEMPYTATDGFGISRINGVIENKSGFTQDFVSVHFNLYDTNGYLIDSASDSIQNLKSGDKWKFSAAILNDDAAYWEFSYISVY